jgi:hypothetical protein
VTQEDFVSDTSDFRSKDAEDEARGASAKADEAVTGASSGPDDPDDEAAAEGLTVSEKDAAAYKASVERGAAQKGEGAPEV